jgi:hypothetical protein
MKPVPHLVALAGVAALAATASAAPRSFVASWGNDANVCSRGSPCRSFAVAIGLTDAGGEVIALDSGAYGPFSVAKSLSIIVPDGVYAGISVTSGVGIDVDIAPTDTVLLRGLTMNATASFNVSAIRLASAGTLVVDRCVLNGTTIYGNGILVSGAQAGQRPRVTVSDTTIRGFDLGVYATGTGGITFPADLSLEIRDSSFVGASFVGIDLTNLDQNADVAIERSVVAHGRIGAGLWQNILYGSGQMNAVIDDTVFAFNYDTGVTIQGYRPGHPRVTLGGNVIVGSNEGLFVGATTGTGDPLGYTRGDNTMRENSSYYLNAWGVAPPL